jgi:3-hydroxyisobutyrate dehydrogenase-like beta-hydroxyacid dehydrogenase
VAAAPLAGRRLALVGLGLMGRAMSGNLLKAGAQLTVHNRSQAVSERFAVEHPGVGVAASPRAAAEAGEIVIVNVTDAPAVEAVLFGPGGIATGDLAGRLVMDMGTSAPSATRRFAARVAERGGAYVDAPVSGGVVGAEAASLSIMVGAGEADFARALPVLQCLGQRITHVGEVGAGQVAKTANQMIVGLTIGAVAEAFALARAAGVAPERLREALMGGFAHSRVLELHGERMVTGSFAPGGKAVIQRKDIRQALELAAEYGLELPATALNHQLWDAMVGKGWGELDHAALIKLYE